MSQNISTLHATFDKSCADLLQLHIRLAEVEAREKSLREQLASAVRERESLQAVMKEHSREIDHVLNQLPWTQLTPELSESGSESAGRSQVSTDLYDGNMNDYSLAFLTQVPASSSPLLSEQ